MSGSVGNIGGGLFDMGGKALGALASPMGMMGAATGLVGDLGSGIMGGGGLLGGGQQQQRGSQGPRPPQSFGPSHQAQRGRINMPTAPSQNRQQSGGKGGSMNQPMMQRPPSPQMSGGKGGSAPQRTSPQSGGGKGGSAPKPMQSSGGKGGSSNQQMSRSNMRPMQRGMKG